jgi:hypothetical protein
MDANELTSLFAQPWSSDYMESNNYLDNVIDQFSDLSSLVKSKALLGVLKEGVVDGDKARIKVDILIDLAKKDDNHVSNFIHSSRIF